MERFRNKYRIQSHRMPQWDYSGNGVYFITLVTKNRECNLGQIITEMDDLCVANDLHGTNGLNGLHGTNGTHDSHVETHGRASLQSPQFPIRKPKSLSSFIAGFKSAVNTKIDDFIDAHDLDMPKYNKNNPFFQPNYHDRIIRNQQEYQRIKEYIIQNPIKWDEDRFNEKLYN